MNLNTTCPWCNQANDRTSQVAAPAEQAAKPTDGDITMCMACGMFSLFEGNQLRRPTRGELIDIGFDPKCRAMRQAWRGTHPRL